jgi:hypothetical protein
MMTFTDFLIGMFLVNGMAHFIFGICNVRFLGLFGYSGKGNIAYGMTSFLVSILIFSYSYGWNSLLDNGIYVGGLAVFMVYLVAGKPLIKVFGEK